MDQGKELPIERKGTPGTWLSIITGLDYWNGLLEWTTGLTFLH